MSVANERNLVTMKLFDLGVEQDGRKPESLKALAWPVNAWACYVPENFDPPLNIFEKLILSLIDKGIAKTKSELKYILSNQIGLNKELVSNIVDECCEKHTDHRFKKELKLDVEAKNNLKTMQEGISLEMQMSEKMKKVYLFQDLITNTVIPCFNIDKLPADYEAKEIDDNNCVAINHNKITTQPKTASINNALYYWTKIQKNKRNDEGSTESLSDMEKAPMPENDDFEDGIFEVEEPITHEAKKDKIKNLKCITIYDDEPTPLVVKGYLGFNPNNPTCVDVISPFGSDFDNWFMKIVNRVRTIDNDFNEELQLFLMDKTEVFKEHIAFDNDLDIQLFDDFPVICNDEKYASLKKSIRDLSKVFARILKGEEDEYSNFAKNLRTAIEVIFREAIKANPDIYRMKYDYNDPTSGFRKFKAEITQIVDAQGLDDEIRRKFHNQDIWKNAINTYGGTNNGNPKDNAALILLYANKHPNSAVMEFVKSYQHIFVDLFDLVRVGNGEAHGNYKQEYTPAKIEQYYAQYENIVRAIYSHLIKGVSDGI